MCTDVIVVLCCFTVCWVKIVQNSCAYILFYTKFANFLTKVGHSPPGQVPPDMCGCAPCRGFGVLGSGTIQHSESFLVWWLAVPNSRSSRPFGPPCRWSQYYQLWCTYVHSFLHQKDLRSRCLYHRRRRTVYTVDCHRWTDWANRSAEELHTTHNHFTL